MKILVSACLLGRNCKYNGGNNYNPGVERFLKDHEVVLCCPEVEAGFPIPRTPMEIVDGRVLDREGRDLDAAVRQAAAETVRRNRDVDLAVLQSRSPTCGVNQVYDGTFSGTLIPGRGVLAQALEEAGIPVRDAEDV